MNEDFLVRKMAGTHGRLYKGFAQEVWPLAKKLKKIGILAVACKPKNKRPKGR